MTKLKNFLVAGVLALVAFAGVAFAAGLYTPGLPVATVLTGNELIPADTLLSGGRSPQTEAISVTTISNFGRADASYSANAATTSTTATAAQMAGPTGFTGGEVVLDMTGTLGGAANLTTPTAAQLVAQLAGFPVGGSYIVRVVAETAANNWTLVGGTGVTVAGTATIVASQFTDFIVTVNSATTMTFQRAGSGTK